MHSVIEVLTLRPSLDMRTLRVLMMLARTLLLRPLLLPLLLRLLLRLLLLLRQHGWSMPDQPCCCGFSFFCWSTTRWTRRQRLRLRLRYDLSPASDGGARS